MTSKGGPNFGPHGAELTPGLLGLQHLQELQTGVEVGLHGPPALLVRIALVVLKEVCLVGVEIYVLPTSFMRSPALRLAPAPAFNE